MLAQCVETSRLPWFCFTSHMMSWDPHGVQRLDEMQHALTQRSVDALVHRAAVDVWRANRERHEPDELFDDAFTLSVLSSRNLANRLFAKVSESKVWREVGVTSSRDFTSTVLHIDGFDVRLVKTPHSAGRKPNFVSDFDWSGSDSRLSAAARNHDAYSPSLRRPEIPPLFEIEKPDASSAVLGCKDAFLVWGADLSSGLTAGWLGIPTTTQDRWLAVTSLWWDGPSSSTVKESTDGNPLNSRRFDERPALVPSITLKPRQAEGTAL